MTTVSIVIINKNETAITDTLRGLGEQAASFAHGDIEIVVVDASAGQLDWVRQQFSTVVWVDYTPVPGTVTIPHQRNHGVSVATGDIIAFIDAGCVPGPSWLTELIAPIRAGETFVSGATESQDPHHRLYAAAHPSDAPIYLEECPTINIAFTRATYRSIGGFDETFQYGSDVDFSWRARDLGHRIRYVPTARITADWGSVRRQLRRSYAYGRARARLYRKHRQRRRSILSRDPIVVVYPLFILFMPLTARWRWYPLLLIVPLIRNRRYGPVAATADHLIYGLGVLREAIGRDGSRR